MASLIDLIRWTPLGTVWECECGKTYIVRWNEGHDGRTYSVCAHSEWSPEKRRERKKRLRRAPLVEEEGTP